MTNHTPFEWSCNVIMLNHCESLKSAKALRVAIRDLRTNTFSLSPHSANSMKWMIRDRWPNTLLYASHVRPGTILKVECCVHFLVT